MLTPVETINGFHFKRDDLYTLYGLSGAKVRGANYLINKGYQLGYKKFTTVGHRKSPQIHIVGAICEQLGFEFVGHTPMGVLPDAFHKFKIIQHKAGYNNVIAKRCKDFAKEYGHYEIPFGMENREVMLLTGRQIGNIPKGVKRIVIPVGSGVNLCGLLLAFRKQKIRIPILGVVVGKSPIKLLRDFAPYGWQGMVELVDAGLPYAKPAKVVDFCGIGLDPIYEAKCVPFIKKGDLFWVIGKRNF